MPFGARLVDGGVEFSLWAPSADAVSLVLECLEIDMPRENGGWRRVTVPGAKAGDRYRFRVGGDLLVPDPASRHQPDDVMGAGTVMDPAAFRWSDAAWTGRPWEEAVIYEAHVGTATPEGTFAALADKLPDLADLGITAIELMPLAEFPGKRNWGYDGVLPFAPDAVYGSPDDLKRLIDRAHGLGLMMLLDVVYNHFGPSGNYLHAYAGGFFTERHMTPWGAAINFDARSARPVRDFFVHNALYWLEEFHFDGLRLDAVHAIMDDGRIHILDEIATAAREACPGRHIHLVLENDANEARRLARDGALPRLYTAQWNDDLHHAWHVLLTGETSGYYVDYADDPMGSLGRALAEGFVYQGEPSAHREGAARGEPSRHLPPTAFVSFLQNHDQIGNRAFGERLTALVPEERLAAARAALLLAPQPPMLFMGEEWGAATPFLYFVDFAGDPDLARAVRDGRRREFATSAAFSDPDQVGRIPDPTEEDTFLRSKLDWLEASRPENAAILEEVRAVLELRRRHVLPLLRSDFVDAEFELPGAAALDVTWRFAAGTLRLLLNAGDDPLDVAAGETRPVWTSPTARRQGGDWLLPSWTVAVFAGGPS